jgi:hypothetical protein
MAKELFDKEMGRDIDSEERVSPEESSSTSDYWFLEEDEKDLSSYLDSMAREYHDYVRISTYFAWARKTWLFYYKMAFQDEGEYFNVGVQALGDEGELMAAQVNHLRNFIQHRVNLVTKDRPSLLCRARNTDLESITQTEFGQGIIDYYMKEKKVESHLARCVEHALVFAEGFLVMTWDPHGGDPEDVDEQGNITYQGDLKFETPVNWNVIRDLGVRDWDKHDWVGIRRPDNKWNLAAKFPEKAKQIKSAERWTDVPLDEGSRPFDEDRYFLDTDQVEVFEWWHKRSPALPQGRYILQCGGAILLDLPWDYDRVPVERVVASELILTPFAYTPAFDLVPIQELINNCVSTIATNQNAHGVQSIWVKAGSLLRTSEILGGMNLVESDEKPESLQLTETPAEVYKFLDVLVRHGELISGVDQVTRGYVEPAVRSGAFAALLQAQSVQFSSDLMRNYHQLLERVGTGIINLIKQFASTERVITIVGKHNEPYTRSYVGDDLELIDRVTVETVDPMFNSYAGRMEWAQLIASTGLVQTPEEMLNVFRTGNPSSLLEANKAQLNIIREENEALLAGQEIPPAMIEDNHVLHIREHLATMGSLEVRQDANKRSGLQAHLMSHIMPLMGDANAQMLQTILGYETPIPPGASPDGAGMPTAQPMGNQPQPGGGGMQPSELAGPSDPSNPQLDGRSQADLPAPSQPQ